MEISTPVELLRSLGLLLETSARTPPPQTFLSFSSQEAGWKMVLIQELSGDPNPQYLLKSTAVQWEAYCRTNGRRTAVQKGGALVGFPFFEAWGILPYKLEVPCQPIPPYPEDPKLTN